MKCVYSTAELVQADLAQSILRSSGIDSRLQSEGSALYGIGLPGPVLLEIMVREEDLGKATDVLQQALPPCPMASQAGEFERKVAKSGRTRLWMWVAALLIPGMVVTIALGLAGDWEPARHFGVFLLALGGVCLLLDRLAKVHRKTKRR